MVKLIELHDKSKFEIFGFSFGPNKDDKMGKRINRGKFKISKKHGFTYSSRNQY